MLLSQQMLWWVDGREEGWCQTYFDHLMALIPCSGKISEFLLQTRPDALMFFDKYISCRNRLALYFAYPIMLHPIFQETQSSLVFLSLLDFIKFWLSVSREVQEAGLQLVKIMKRWQDSRVPALWSECHRHSWTHPGWRERIWGDEAGAVEGEALKVLLFVVASVWWQTVVLQTPSINKVTITSHCKVCSNVVRGKKKKPLASENTVVTSASGFLSREERRWGKELDKLWRVCGTAIYTVDC